MHINTSRSSSDSFIAAAIPAFSESLACSNVNYRIYNTEDEYRFQTFLERGKLSHSLPPVEELDLYYSVRNLNNAMLACGIPCGSL